MKRLDYETLAMEEVAVEMEYGFLAASVVNTTNQGNVETTGHELNNVDLGDKEWNDSTWE